MLLHPQLSTINGVHYYMVDNNSSDFSFKISLNPTLLAFILGSGAATITVLGIQNTINTIDNNQILNNEQTQIVDCPSVEQPNTSMNPH